MTDEFGATGEFPRGKLGETDEGALRFGIAAKDGQVLVNFGTPVVWFALPPQQVADLASAILKAARDAAGADGAPLTFIMPFPNSVSLQDTLAEQGTVQ